MQKVPENFSCNSSGLILHLLHAESFAFVAQKSHFHLLLFPFLFASSALSEVFIYCLFCSLVSDLLLLLLSGRETITQHFRSNTTNEPAAELVVMFDLCCKYCHYMPSFQHLSYFNRQHTAARLCSTHPWPPWLPSQILYKLSVVKELLSIIIMIQ